MTWRDGIHISGTSIWCDAKRARDVCFVSSASQLRGTKHGQVIATPETIGLLDVSSGTPSGVPSKTLESPLAVPVGQPFTLGNNRLELFSSGHGYGSASLLISAQNMGRKATQQKLVYAGAVNPNGSSLGGSIDHRAATILVLSASYSQPHYAFPEPEDVLQSLKMRCQEVSADGGVAVLLLRNTSKALDTAFALQDCEIPLHVHRSFYAPMKSLLQTSTVLHGIKRWNPQGKGGRILLWPGSARDAVDLSRLPKASAVFLVSGAAANPDAISYASASEGFVWSDQADFASLIHYIKSVKAQQVYLTNTSDRGTAIAEALPDVQVEAIGPPEQLHLF